MANQVGWFQKNWRPAVFFIPFVTFQAFLAFLLFRIAHTIEFDLPPLISAPVFFGLLTTVSFAYMKVYYSSENPGTEHMVRGSLVCTVFSIILLAQTISVTVPRPLITHTRYVGLTPFLKDVVDVFVTASPLVLSVLFTLAYLYGYSRRETESSENESRTDSAPRYLRISAQVLLLILVLAPTLFLTGFAVHDPQTVMYQEPTVNWGFEHDSENKTVSVIHRGGNPVNNSERRYPVRIYIGDKQTQKQISEFEPGDEVEIEYENGDIGKKLGVVIDYPPSIDDVVLSEHRIEGK